MTGVAALRRCSQRGTSLVEMLAALSILALGAIVVTPFFAPTPQRELATLEATLATSLIAARSQALRASETVRWALDRKAKTIDTSGPNGATRASIEMTEGIKIAADGLILLPGASQPILLQFFPDGSSSGLRLSLSEGGHARSLEVDAISGSLRRSAER